MTDPNEIARGIASNVVELLNILRLSRQDQENYEAVVQEIAAALREADAGGYRRGYEEGRADHEEQ